MSEERSEFRGAPEEAREGDGGTGGGGHPDLERLAAYHAGGLPEAEAEGVREHLSRCRECADLLLDWRDFARDEPAGAASAAAAAWERDRDRVREGVARRVGAAGPGTGTAPPSARTAGSQEADPVYAGLPRGGRAPWLAAAAALAAATLFGGLWWQERAEVERPRQVQLTPLVPAGSSILRGREEEAELLARPGTWAVVALNVAEPAAHARYEARIVPPAGEGSASVVELSPRDNEPFLVQMGRDLEPGDYQVLLYGIDGDERRELAIYRFRVRTP